MEFPSMPLSQSFSLILSSLKPYRFLLGTALVFILIHTLFGLSLIFLTSRFQLQYLPVFLILLFSIHHLLSVFDDWILTGISQRWIQDTRLKCLRTFLEVSEKSKKNSLMDWNEMQMEIHWLGESIFSMLRSSLRKVFQILVFSAALFWLSPILFLFCGLLFVFVFLLGWFFGRKINQLQEQVITEQTACSNFEYEAARAMPLVRAYHKGDLFFSIHHRFLLPYTQSSIRLARLRMIFHPIQILLFLATLVVVYTAGSILVRDHHLSPNEFYSFLAGLSLLHAPLSGLSQDISIFLSTHNMKYLSPILEEVPSDGVVVSTKQVSHIVVQDLSYTYASQVKPLLTDLHCQFNAGSITGIRGANGSGKTTLALLLAGILKPDSGQILFDGLSDHHVPVGYIDQNGTVLTLNLAQNLFLDEPGSSRDLLNSSTFLQFLSSHSSFDNLSPENLSAGQRKAISIERAFLSNLSVLIIDEPENALDESMQEFFRQQILKRKAQNSLIILFSHSDAFLSICDQQMNLSDLTGSV